MSLIKSNNAGLGGSGSPGGALTSSFFSETIDTSIRLVGDSTPANGGRLTKTFSTVDSDTDFTLNFWIKRNDLVNPVNSSYPQFIFNFRDGTSGSALNDLCFLNSSSYGVGASLALTSTNNAHYILTTTNLLRDYSAWYNIHIMADMNNSTASSKLKFFINGVEATYATDNRGSYSDLTGLKAGAWTIGDYYGTSYCIGSSIARWAFVDNSTLAASNFGEFKDGIWIPKEITGITWGSAGHLLDFAGTGTSADANGIGADTSGQGNHWTLNNIDANDRLPDTPTNNWATLNPLVVSGGSPTLSEGNLKLVGSGSDYDTSYATIAVTSGKWYAEFLYVSGDDRGMFGVVREDRLYYVNGSAYIGSIDDTYGIDFRARAYTGTSATSSSGSELFDATNFNTGDIGLLCFDVDNGKLWFGRRDVSGSTTIWYDSSGNNNGDPSAGSNPTYTFTATGSTWFIGCHDYAGTTLIANFGQDGSFAGALTSQAATDANGLGDFNYIESGFLALCTSNLPDITLGPDKTNQADDFFDTILYTGNGNELAVGTGGMRRPLDTISIAQSLRFNDSSLHRDISSSGNTRTWTWSAWVKRSSLGGSNGQYLFTDGNSSSLSSLNFDSNDKLYIQLRDTTGGTSKYKLTTREFKDIRTWYHIVWRVDTTQSTDADRSRIYINGTQITAFDTEQHVDQNDETTINASGNDHLLGAYNTSSTTRHFDGYMAEVNLVDGQSYGPDTFGQIGANDDWIPKTLSGVSYGSSNNSFRLDFADGSALGDDESGNGNDFDVTDNVSSTDKISDSPTQNFATLDSTRPSGTTLTMTEGALKAERTSSSFAQAYSNVVITEGKFYAEVLMDTGNCDPGVIVGNTIPGSNRYLGQDSYTYGYYRDGRKINNGSYTAYGGTYSVAADGSGDVVGILINADDGEISFSVNGTVQNSGTPAFTGLTGPYRFAVDSENSGFVLINFGQDDTFNGLKTSGSAAAADGNGNGKFYDTPPSGYLALMDDNLPRKSDVIGPDWVWIKGRSNTTVHSLHDTLRGTQLLQSNAPDGQQDNSNYLLSFDSQGFTVGDNSNVNQSTHSYVGWVWKAGGTPTADNAAAANAEPTAGSAKIDESNQSGAFSGPPSIAIKRLSASTTAGFSIVRWTGTGSAGTLPHGLGVTPEFIYVKNLEDDTKNWNLYPTILGNNYLELNGTGTTFSGSTYFNNTAPTANVFSVGSAGSTNNSSDDFIAYVFAPIEGYSKFGSYIGNNDADGTFVFTGFRPAWVMIKRVGTGGWHMFDNKRSFSSDYFNAGNEIDVRIEAQDTGAENTSGPPHIDFVSNGFKLRTDFDNMNASGDTYIYLAFAEAPFKFANARS